MLTLKSISKTYKPKKGAPVQALKDISLSFEDSGMVFLLGKSGSGKSTLLNLIGGLDFADRGEIIIDGRSTKDFNQRDYDSYRNTYIGFVFQEYNVLNDFTVGENISLALELQNQKGQKQKVDDILKEVDLEGYGDRKPNELSGGQKQRVAIARAIVKDPKIIMADEPTGALDSETGKAIFDTLKRLSKDRLVIVVSHDREFAETYGDRIIELADGEVISDRTLTIENKIKERPSVEMKKSRMPYRRALSMGAKTMRSKRLRLVIAILLCFLSFASFGFADVMLSFDVKKMASANLYEGNDNYISINSFEGEDKIWSAPIGVECTEEDLQRLRELTGLNFQGAIGGYYTPQVWNHELLEMDNEIEYYLAGGYGLECALPASQELFDALGFKLYGRLPSNEKEIVITKRRYEQYKLAGIGIGSTIIYPNEIGDIQNFMDKIIPRINSRKEYSIVGIVDTFADADGRLKNCNPRDNYMLNWTLRKYFEKSYHNLCFIHQSSYDKYIEEKSAIDETGFGKLGAMYIFGEEKEGLNAKGTATQESLKYVDKVVWLDGKGDRKELAENEILIGCNVAKFLWPAKSDRYESSIKCNYSREFINGKVSFKNMSLYEFRSCGGADIIAYCIEADEISSQELEIYKEYCLVNFKYVTGFFRFSNMCKEFTVKNKNFDLDTMTEDDWRFSYACYLSQTSESDPHTGIEVEGGYNHNVTGRKSGKEIEKNSVKIFVENRIENDLKSAGWTPAKDYSLNYVGSMQRREYSNIKFDSAPVIAGIYFAKEGYSNDYVINDKAYYKSLDYEPSLYNFLIVPFSGKTRTKDVVDSIIELHYDTSEFRNFYCNNPIVNELQFVAVAYNGMKKMFYWIGAILGLFSILLLGNYIELSISSKKREIGILRAVGAKKSDIVAIFVNEGVIIAVIVVLLAVMGAGLLTLGFNGLVPSFFGLTYDIKLLSFGIRQIAILLAVCFGTTAVASAIPLFKLSRKKPVDSIQDR